MLRVQYYSVVMKIFCNGDNHDSLIQPLLRLNAGGRQRSKFSSFTPQFNQNSKSQI